QIIIQFNELMDPATSSDQFAYSISGGLAVLTATPNGSSVTLTLDPGTPEAEDTLYTVTVMGAEDAAGNPIAAGSTVQFRSWTSAGCNGVLFEVYRPLSTTDNALNTTLLVD